MKSFILRIIPELLILVVALFAIFYINHLEHTLKKMNTGYIEDIQHSTEIQNSLKEDNK